MPRSTQIVPEHSYPHQMVVINDNSQYLDTPSSDSGDTKMLFVFSSPKGRDGKVQTITTGCSGFLEEYGIGPFSLYGQPLLNAYNAALSGAATLHCLRVTAPNAAYSVSNLVAKYKVDVTGETIVKFSSVVSDAPLTDLDNLEECYTAPAEVDVDGFTTVKILSVAYVGKGLYGDNVRYRISNYGTGDKENSYKNYLFEVLVNDGGLVKKEEYPVVFNEDASYSGVSLFSDALINDPDAGSNIVKVVTYVDNIKEIVEAYNTGNPDSVLTVNDFDIFLGINKYTKTAIPMYTVDTTTEGTVAVNDLAGISLLGGDDGDLSASKTAIEREAALETAYTDAFSGTTDPYIKSKNKFPTNIILDANYPISVKPLIASLATARTDCIAILDCGTGITTKQSLIDYVKTNLDSYVSDRVQAIDGYFGKIKDPYSDKVISVTSTFKLASEYPLHFKAYGGKHVPLAGNNYGVLSGFIKNSVSPVFDEDIDSDMMDELADSKVNFARINAKQDIIRATQTTRQDINSNLSELNNVFILLDVKRDCERICTEFDFNFSEPEDIARFNTIAKDLLSSYSGSQVKSISAAFNKNAWEAERGILHLNVGFANKDLVKTAIIEIDVNRG